MLMMILLSGPVPAIVAFPLARFFGGCQGRSGKSRSRTVPNLTFH
jgi:hypothetical protein